MGRGHDQEGLDTAGSAGASEITQPDWRVVQQELLDLFGRHDLQVGVGLIRNGVAIRSQDQRVDVENIGPVTASPA